jgi:hypothetical protein
VIVDRTTCDHHGRLRPSAAGMAEKHATVEIETTARARH